MKKLFNLFRNPTHPLSKEEYWKKWELIELIEDLHLAEALLSKYEGGYSGDFLSAQEFHRALIEEIDKLESENRTDLNQIWIWFSPTCAWDDFVGRDGIELGNRIFQRADNWKKGTKNL